ncbi:MAG: lytic murein transglycosylase [Cellvibrionaceae bacterium]|nr:lytic murein transglycosylase [Cellvibrionaceae bacterium]
MERRLISLEVFAAQTGLLSARDKENLHNAWHTIRVDWQGDDVIDNFELHSHFIEQLHTMIAGLAKFLEKPVSVVVADKNKLELPAEDSAAYPKMFKQIELLNFAARQVTTMAEQVGRIRALSTYAAAKGLCDYHHDRKLRYALSTARASNEKLRHQTERLESLLAGALPSISMIKTYELKLMFLLNTVEADVLSGMTITTKSHNLFKLATEIIDVYLKVVDDSVDLLSRWNDEDLDGWVCLV